MMWRCLGLPAPVLLWERSLGAVTRGAYAGSVHTLAAGPRLLSLVETFGAGVDSVSRAALASSLLADDGTVAASPA